jgi:Colicin D
VISASQGGDLAIAPVPGDPYFLLCLAAQLGSLADDLDQAGAGLLAIESVKWNGPAAGAFRSVMQQQPTRYSRAAESFAIAAAAVARYSAALEEAQILAVRASQLADAGEIASRRWEATTAGAPAVSTPDPGAGDRLVAEQMNYRVSDDLTTATRLLVATLQEVELDAPRHPTLLHEVLTDAWHYSTTVPADVGIGFGKGLWGMLDGGYQLGSMFEAETNPTFQLLDPKAADRAHHELAAIATEAWDHPGTVAKAMGEGLVDWNEWSENPAEAAGELLPTVLLTIATAGGATAARISVAGTTIDEIEAVAEAGDAVDPAVDADEAASSNELPPLLIDRRLAEAKFKHADAFGVLEPRSTSGFTSFEKAIQGFLDDPETVSVRGTYRGAPSILSYNQETFQVVVQDPNGKFVSGWRMSEKQLRNVLSRRRLGGG